jgi:hypothetical protein
MHGCYMVRKHAYHRRFALYGGCLSHDVSPREWWRHVLPRASACVSCDVTSRKVTTRTC